MLPQSCAKTLPILILAFALGLPWGAGAAAAAATFLDRLEAAHGLIADRRYREARALLHREVAPLARQPSQHALLLAAQATAEAALHNDAQAVALIQRVFELRRHLPAASEQRLRFLLGQLQLRGGDYAAAVEALEAWLRATDRSSPEAHWLLASAYLLQDRLEAGRIHVADGLHRLGDPSAGLCFVKDIRLLPRSLRFLHFIIPDDGSQGIRPERGNLPNAAPRIGRPLEQSEPFDVLVGVEPAAARRPGRFDRGVRSGLHTGEWYCLCAG